MQLLQGTLGMEKDTKFFVEHYNAYIVPTKFSFKEVRTPVQIGADHLTAVEHPAVQINMSQVDFEKICHKLAKLHEEEELRMQDEETFNLWMRYKVYAELKR